MKPSRLIALIVGCLLLLPGLALLLGGGSLGAAYVFERDRAGFFSTTVDRLESPTAAITAGDLDLVTDPGSPDWLLDRLDADVRLEVTPAGSGGPLFVGIGPAADVDAYLAGAAHDEVVDATGDTADYRRSAGQAALDPPGAQRFWVESATGAGPQRLDWTATSGRWAVALMNADGSPGVAAEATVGARAGFVLPLAVVLLGLGEFTTAVAVLLILVGVRGQRAVRPLTGAGAGVLSGPPAGAPASPVSVSAALDPGLSRWMWLVKWVLVLPHLVVLAILWPVFVVLTLVAGVAILCTGTYPRGIFEVNVGVLRWSWRVSYYATTGGMGTDRYPPFRLSPEPGYPATLDVAYPGRLSRGLVLVKWVLALPHYVVVSVLLGGSLGWVGTNGEQEQLAPLAGGLLGLLVLVAGVVLLVTGRYPRGLFDLVLGLNRWVYRTVAYAALMTDRYPPFRLDQGGAEPGPAPAPAPPPPAGPRVDDRPARDLEPVAR